MPLRTFIDLREISLFALLLAVSCGSAGPYSFARSYHPLGDEKPHYKAAQQLSYEEVKRDPNGYKQSELAWFGVVTSYADLPDGRVRLGLSLRAHQARHLCSDEPEESCRVTVSEKDLGPFSADVQLRADETEGKDRLWMGSLVKIYGMPTGDYDEEGGPILDAKYHRHWPRGYYVTTAQRGAMRR